MKKYGYSSAIVSDVVVRESKRSEAKNEIVAILDDEHNNNLIFITGYLSKNNELYLVNIHKEFCMNPDAVNIDQSINYLLKEHKRKDMIVVNDLQYYITD